MTGLGCAWILHVPRFRPGALKLTLAPQRNVIGQSIDTHSSMLQAHPQPAIRVLKRRT